MAQDVPLWILSCTAIGSISGPVVAYLIASNNIKVMLENTKKQIRATTDVAKLQIHANVISLNRQKWIDAIRDDLSSFVAEIEVVRESLRDAKREPLDVHEISKPLAVYYNKIRLRLNPDKSDHVEIIEAMGSILADLNCKDMRVKIEHLVDLGQKLIRKEWVRVKVGG